MTRGIRGATTVVNNEANEILEKTKALLEEMIEKNNIIPASVSHVFVSVTSDIDAVFPAKSIREFPGWKYVPVMCMREIDVPNSLEKCIRIMMVVNTAKSQQDIQHIFQKEAIRLRPDLVEEEE